MIRTLTAVKDRLSHINARSWHWKVTKEVFGKKAQGKACTYYWFKVPLSMLGLAVLAIFIALRCVCRVFFIAIMWVLGYRFNERIFDLEADTMLRINYDDYKERPDGSKSRFAPWEILLVPLLAWLVWLLVVVYPSAGKVALVILLGIATGVILIYFITAASKYPPIVRARAAVNAAWDRVCPPLVVEGEQNNEIDD
jgi:hypothetical protein